MQSPYKQILTTILFLSLASQLKAMVFSTYLGGSNFDYPSSVVVDHNGAPIVIGWTSSNDFPITQGAFDLEYNGDNPENNGGQNDNSDITVSKMSSDGTQLLYSTFIGGSRKESAYTGVSDGNGGVILAGETWSTDAPTTEGAIQRERRGYCDVYIARLNEEGNQIIFATMLGGEGLAFKLCSTEDRGVVITGVCYEDSFPTTESAFDRNYSGQKDCFITKINSDGTEIVYSTLLGSDEDDITSGLDLDLQDRPIVTGFTQSDNFPVTEGAFDHEIADYDIFVTKFTADCQQLVFSTFIGGDEDEQGRSIIDDGESGVYVAGYTRSRNFPITEDAFDTESAGPGTGFVLHLSSTGERLIAATFMGGDRHDVVNEIELLGNGEIIGVGISNGGAPTTEDRLMLPQGDQDGFLFKLGSDLTELLFGSYWGGNRGDYINTFSRDDHRGIIILGSTTSTRFPISENAFDQSYNDDHQLSDYFVSRVDLNLPELYWVEIPRTISARENELIEFDVIGRSNINEPEMELNFDWRDAQFDHNVDHFSPGSAHVSFIADREFIGVHSLEVTLFDGIDDLVTLILIEIVPGSSIPLRAGWSMISSPIIVNDADIRDVMSDLVERDNLVIIKDGLGRFYIPSQNFSNMAPWSPFQGYQIRMARADTLELTGDEYVLSDAPIALRRGWNLISYLPPHSQDARQAFSNIRDHLLIAKDEFGQFYLPRIDFNNMRPLQGGRGYFINVDDNVEFRWNVNHE